MMLAMLGVLSSIMHPPKILVFGLVFGCSDHGPLMVGGMGRAALYVKVSPNGLWPAAQSRPVAGFSR